LNLNINNKGGESMEVSAVGSAHVPGALEVAAANRTSRPPDNASDVAQQNLNSRVSATATDVAQISRSNATSLGIGRIVDILL